MSATPEPARVATGCIMQVTPNLDVGGAQENLLTMAKYFAELGHRNVVCTFSDGPLRTEIEALGVPVLVLPDRTFPVTAVAQFTAEMLRRRRVLRALIAEHGVTVVQTRGLGTLDFLVMTLRRPGRVQVWWTIENVEFTLKEEHVRRRSVLRAKRGAHRLLYRIGVRVVDGVIVVSDDTARSFCDTVRCRRSKVAVVLNAVDAERYPAKVDRDAVRAALGFARGDHVMTMVGTFKHQKGHEVLVRAFSGIAARHAGVHLQLVGDGELAERVRHQVHGARLEARVHFLGTRRDVDVILAASDSFVLASLWEGLPIALVEAMASRLPVVATDVSGTRQVMLDGVTGWLAPPGDVDRLAAAMEEVVSYPHEAARRAMAARTRIETQFHARRQARQLIDLFGGAA